MFFARFFQRIIDFVVTVILWLYFMFGYLFIVFFLFLPVYVFARNRATALQNLNHVHFKIFFALTRMLVPRAKFDLDQNVRQIHSSVVVCNHLSYLDPILLVSLFKRQRTIVKHTFFKVPIFGWFLTKYGYMSSGDDHMMGPAIIDKLEDIKKHLAEGGVLFVFPEGTRSRDGKLEPFNKGVFTIARYCNAPLQLLLISGTNKLFQPGHFLFNTCEDNEIKVELIGSLQPDYRNRNFSAAAVAEGARKTYEVKIASANDNR